MGVHDKLLDFLLFFMLFVQSLDAICTGSDSGTINDNHPSISNNWSDLEQWNSSALLAFCPSSEGGTLRIDCADDNGEPMGSSKITRTYSAACTIQNGLICSRSNHTNGRCPDFSIKYICVCPRTTTKNTVSVGNSFASTSKHVTSNLPKGHAAQHNHTDNGGNVSTGAIVGIAVGVVVILSLVGGGVLIYFNISKKNRRNKVDDILNA